MTISPSNPAFLAVPANISAWYASISTPAAIAAATITYLLE